MMKMIYSYTEILLRGVGLTYLNLQSLLTEGGFCFNCKNLYASSFPRLRVHELISLKISQSIVNASLYSIISTFNTLLTK